jgi:hypothetical protein
MTEDERLRLEYDGYLEDLFLKAETATNGYMVRRAFEDTVDPRDLYWRRGPLPTRAISEDLTRFWNENPDAVPLTFTEYRTGLRELRPAV